MTKALILIVLFFSALSQGCASFDRTNIQPGQRVQGPGFSFEVPTQRSWFAVVYGTSHRLKLSQLNRNDSYAIVASLNRGPYSGMYASADTHLKAYRDHINKQTEIRGYQLISQETLGASNYGDVCIMHKESAQDWRGRNSAGPALVDKVKLVCAHPYFDNLLASFEISHRFDQETRRIELLPIAKTLFSSIEYQEIEN